MQEVELTILLFMALLILPTLGLLIRFVKYYFLYKFFSDGKIDYPAWKAALFGAFFLNSSNKGKLKN
jgi:NhaP-type Na+/H+ or K+/H+ antiporter